MESRHVLQTITNTNIAIDRAGHESNHSKSAATWRSENNVVIARILAAKRQQKTRTEVAMLQAPETRTQCPSGSPSRSTAQEAEWSTPRGANDWKLIEKGLSPAASSLSRALSSKRVSVTPDKPSVRSPPVPLRSKPPFPPQVSFLDDRSQKISFEVWLDLPERMGGRNKTSVLMQEEEMEHTHRQTCDGQEASAATASDDKRRHLSVCIAETRSVLTRLARALNEEDEELAELSAQMTHTRGRRAGLQTHLEASQSYLSRLEAMTTQNALNYYPSHLAQSSSEDLKTRQQSSKCRDDSKVLCRHDNKVVRAHSKQDMEDTQGGDVVQDSLMWMVHELVLPDTPSGRSPMSPVLPLSPIRSDQEPRSANGAAASFRRALDASCCQASTSSFVSQDLSGSQDLSDGITPIDLPPPTPKRAVHT